MNGSGRVVSENKNSRLAMHVFLFFSSVIVWLTNFFREGYITAFCVRSIFSSFNVYDIEVCKLDRLFARAKMWRLTVQSH